MHFLDRIQKEHKMSSHTEIMKLEAEFWQAMADQRPEQAAALLAALLEQPDSAPAAAAPRALRADARMKFLREILFIVRESFPFFFFFQKRPASCSLTLF